MEDYRARTDAALQLVASSRLPEATRNKARFAMQLMCDAFAPSNIPWLNPGVVKEATETAGLSLVKGLQNFLDDVANNGGYPRQVDRSGFELGVNIAATPGRVVMRNELMELIAYEPQTPQVHAVPLLCSPPWINKYYIMDLAPGRSFVEWAVQHGHQTFMISYRNPDVTQSQLTMDDYLRDGILAALDAVQEITGAPQVNLSGLCLGGTMALIALAYLAAHGQADRIASTSVTNTLIDFGLPGDLGIFTDEDTIARLEKRMNERGYLESAEMARTFDWMRSSDLIWSYVVNNWFKGKQPPAFDILAWNADSTRMPVAMHSQYLRTCYLHNSIVKPNAFVIDDTPIDLGKIQTPLYVLGAETDHIAPWRATYLTTQHVERRVEVRPDQLRAYRGDRQSARRQEDLALHQAARDPGRERGRMAGERGSPSGVVVGGLGRLGRGLRRPATGAVRFAGGRAGPRTLRLCEPSTALRVTCKGRGTIVSDEEEKSSGSDAWRGLGEFIRGQRELANLSMRQLAEIAKISNPYLSQVERGLYKPSADVLKSIANALHLSAETMYSQAGLLDNSGSRDESHHGVEHAIKVDPKLSVDQKESLIRIYRSFTGDS